jgi:hypothetical protein
VRGFKCNEQKKTQNQNTVFVSRRCSLKPIIEIRFILLSVVLNILLSALHILYGCVEYDLIMDFKMLNMYSVLSNLQYCKNGRKTEEIEAFLSMNIYIKKKNENEVYIHGQHLINWRVQIRCSILLN